MIKMDTMKLFYEEEFVKIYNTDSAQANLNPTCRNLFDAVITDPPYNVGKDYGNGSKADKREDYIDWLNGYWKYLSIFVKAGGFLVYTNITQFIPQGMKPPEPWRYFHLACWNKPLSLRPAFYGICPHWEPIFICLKGKKPWRKFRDKDVFSDVISANVVYDKDGNKEHPAPKPLKLYIELVKWATPPNGWILEPFGGTGTTALAAKVLKRHCVMFETNERYCQIAAERIKKGLTLTEVLL